MRLSTSQYQEYLMSKEARREAKNARRGKYKNVKTEIDGIVFDSEREAVHYRALKTLEKVGKIRDLKLQVSYDIHINGMLVCTYRADFDYWRDNEHVVDDVKGYRTEVYKLKKKLMLAVNGVRINEI